MEGNLESNTLHLFALVVQHEELKQTQKLNLAIKLDDIQAYSCQELRT